MKKTLVSEREILDSILPNAKKWWQEHPNATLADIEEAIEEQLSKIQGNRDRADNKKWFRR
jgi:hypothetical protein